MDQTYILTASLDKTVILSNNKGKAIVKYHIDDPLPSVWNLNYSLFEEKKEALALSLNVL